VNCRSLADGKQIWQFSGSARNPAQPRHYTHGSGVDGRFVISLDPKAVLHCLDAKTGKQIWRKSLVTEYKATIPSWYNGQNPLQEEDRVIIATGGRRHHGGAREGHGQRRSGGTPNPGSHAHYVRHASVIAGRGGGRSSQVSFMERSPGRWGVAAKGRQALCGVSAQVSNVAGGAVAIAVSEEFGLHEPPAYDRGGASHGRVCRRTGEHVSRRRACSTLKNNEWNSEVAHTHRVQGPHVRRGEEEARPVHFAWAFDGKEVWTSEGKASFGLGQLPCWPTACSLLLDGDTGKLHLIEASTTAYNETRQRSGSGPERGSLGTNGIVRTASSCCRT